MKKTMLAAFLSVFIIPMAFSEHFVIDNQTIHPRPHRQSSLAIQWATSSKEIAENQHLTNQMLKRHSNTLTFITQRAKIAINSPQHAEYFRVLVWSTGEKNPRFVTNWVDIVQNKTYTLTTEHFIPVALMAGTGC